MRAKDLHSDGTYAKATITNNSKNVISELMEDISLTDGIDKDKLHTTVIYSTKPCPNIMEVNNTSIPFNGTVTELKSWKNSDGTYCLVAVIDCADLVKLHYDLLEKYKATDDFPEYIPHITLCYSYDGKKIKLPDNDYAIKYAKLEVSALESDWNAS